MALLTPSKLYNFGGHRFGRHGDLKSENIFLFKELDDFKVDERGILFIADVGLARYHNTVTADWGTVTMSGKQVYEPPDIDIELSKPRSRKYDIWAMGCMFLEFAIWLLRGIKEVEKFKAQRGYSFYRGEDYKFYIITEQMWNDKPSKAEIHPMVRSWIDELYKDPRCEDNPAFKALLMLIDKSLLRVEVNNSAEATKAYEELSEIVEEAKADPRLAQQGASTNSSFRVLHLLRSGGIAKYPDKIILRLLEIRLLAWLLEIWLPV